MAGIGFELKKLFSKKGLFALVGAYGYAGAVCIGPMLLGMILLFGVHIIAEIGGAAKNEQDLLICMITYTLLASLLVTNILSMITTRYVADMLYLEKEEKVMPSFYGSTAIMYIVGGTLYGVFLIFSGVEIEYIVCCLVLFMELIAVWTQISYLTAVKDYKGIMKAFLLAAVSALLLGYILVCLGLPSVISLLYSVVIGYGLMMVWYYKLLIEYFPKGKGSSMAFLKWIDKYPELVGVGSFIGIGLFVHLILMWFSPLGAQVKGLFYSAAGYDVPALFAFISILITSINFVTSVEVNFYPKYRTYFGLFNGGGTLIDIERAEIELKNTLGKELSYTFAKQFFVTVVFIVGGTIFIPNLPFGFTEEMLGIYRVLCVGYAFYSAGNCIMLMSLYLADNRGALISSFVYAASSCVGTAVGMFWDSRYYGFGFLVAGILFTAVAFIRMMLYIKKLSFHIVSKQPLIAREKIGWATRISEKFERIHLEKMRR